MFVLDFAGNDTTANTLASAVVIRAAKLLVQDWISEELRHVLSSREVEDWNYNGYFPQLKRCLAVLLETLRLCTPVPIAKSTGKEASVLIIGNKQVTIPANTLIIPNYIAVHTHPRSWDDDALEWKPFRWIEAKGSTRSLKDEFVLHQRKVPSSLGLKVYEFVLVRSSPR
jgi:cytochrome P450